MTHKTILIAATVLLCSTAALAKDIKEMAVKASPSVETVEQGQALTNALRAIPGVKKVKAPTVEMTVNVKYDADKTSKSAILKAMSKMGYKTYVVSEDGEGSKHKVDATTGATQRKSKK